MDVQTNGLAGAVCERIAEQLGRAEALVTVDARLTDLVVDSVDLIEVAIDLQEEHGVWFEERDLLGLTTVGDLVALIQRRKVELGVAG